MNSKKGLTKIEALIIVLLVITISTSSAAILYVAPLSTSITDLSQSMSSVSNKLNDVINGINEVLNRSSPTSPNETKYGGTLTLLSTLEPTTLDQINEYTNPEFATIVYELYDHLVEIGPDQQLHPCLATSWEMVTPTEWIFNLRKGVKFHDGTVFNATNVKYVYEYIRDTPSVRQAAFAHLDRVEVVDEYKVKFIYKYAFSDHLFNLAIWCGPWSKAARDKWGNAFGTHPIGAGPYKFVEWVSGDHITLEAFEDYWAGRPYIDKLVLRIIPETSTQILEIKKGGAQVLQRISTIEAYNALKGDPNIQVVIGPTYRNINLHLNNELEPLKDKNVRMAINYAVNREAICSAVFAYLAVPSFSPIWSTSSPFYNPSLKKFTYDLQKAKQYMANSSYPNGFEMVCFSETFPEHQQIQTIVQAQLAEIGIKVNILYLEHAVAMDRLVRKYPHDYGVSVRSWMGSGAPTPYGCIGDHYYSGNIGANKWNYECISDPRIDAASIAMRNETGFDKLKELCDNVTRVLNDEAYTCFLVSTSMTVAIRSNVEGVVVSGLNNRGLFIHKPAVGVAAWIKQ